MKGRFRWAILAAVACLVFAPSVGVAQPVVVPNSLATTEGNSANVFPWRCNPSHRYQQVYLGTEVGSGLIGAIRFRQDDSINGAFSSTFLNLTITLSTTGKLVDDLSFTFSDNVGPDVTTVFSGNLSLSSPDCSTSPCPFDIVIPLTTPFPFDASAGNLLLDVTIPTCQELGPINFDAHDATDSVSRAFRNDASSATAFGVDSLGLVTRFDFLPPPAPAPTLSLPALGFSLLLLAGVSAFGIRRLRRGR